MTANDDPAHSRPMSVANISTNFTWAEAMCHSGAEVPLELQPNARRLAVNVLELVRARFGGPLIPLSWYRTPEYNSRIHGAPKSQHMLALAADIRPADMNALGRLRATVETLISEGMLPALGGFGVYPNWLHLDARTRPIDNPSHIARWFGKGVGSET